MNNKQKQNNQKKPEWEKVETDLTAAIANTDMENIKETKREREITQLKNWIATTKEKLSESELLGKTLTEIKEKHNSTDNPYIIKKLGEWDLNIKNEQAQQIESINQLETTLAWLVQEKENIEKINSTLEQVKKQLTSKEL